MTKYITISFVTVLLIAIIVLTIGSHQAHSYSKQHNFIGIVGGHIYVDNSSGKPISQADLTIMWHGLYKGAPGPILEGGRLITRRIEILKGSSREDQECGSFEIRLYTFFNKSFLTTNANYPCA